MNGWDWIPLVARWRYQEETYQVILANEMMRGRVPPPSYHEALLALAQQLLAEARLELAPEIAVILAQMACEIRTEQILAPLLKGEQLRNFNLDNENVRKTYTARTGDRIDEEAFWGDYHEHVVRRHEIVHHGRRVDGSLAAASCDIAAKFLQHINVVRGKL